jgi:chemotaxis protein methyltransferase CheR
MSLQAADLRWVQDLVYARAAIVLEPGKSYLVESRLDVVAREEGYANAVELIGLLRKRGGNPLETRVVEALTINETSFFRDVHPFEALRETIVPALLEGRKRERTLRIWSAACSSGQEAYSVAMLLRDGFPQLRDWSVQIVGTDISAAMVERTKLGRYSQLEVNRGLGAPQITRWFERQGSDFVVRAELRAMVEARLLNLASAWPLGPDYDVVFLRNVLIYFDVPTKRAILDRVLRAMRPDSCLFLGGAETTLQVHEGFERVQSGRAVWYRPVR